MVKARVVFDRIANLSAGAAGVILAFVMLVICAEVVMRYFLHRPIAWAVIASESALLYITFLTATWVLQKEGHVTVEILTDRLNPRTQAMLKIISSVIGVAICLVFVVYGAQVTWEHYLLGFDTGGLVPVPTAYLHVIIPICSLLLLIQFLRRGYGYLGRWRALSDKDKAA